MSKQKTSDWLTTSGPRTLSQLLPDAPSEKVYPKRGESFEDSLRRTFREGAQEAKGIEKPSPIKRDEGDAAILATAAYYARVESNGRASERYKAKQRKQRLAATSAPAEETQPTSSLDERLRAWAEQLTPEQRDEFEFSERYANMPAQARARVDRILASFRPKPEPPTAEEQEQFESGLEREDEYGDDYYDGVA